MRAYDGDPDYDFKTELDAARERESLRRHREQLVLEQEEEIGARLVCETSGMPPVTRRQLDRHEQLYGGVDDVLAAAILEKSGTRRSEPSTDGGKRPVRSPTQGDGVLPWGTVRTRNLGHKIISMHQRGRSAMTIADMLGKSDVVVRRYLREAQAAGLLAA